MKYPLITLQRIILLVGLLLMAIKFLAWYLTDSNALLTDALESIVNVVAGTFTLYSLLLAAKPMDKDHPYGHGKIEYIASGIEGTLIGLAGVSMIIKAALEFNKEPEIHSLDIGLGIATLAGLINYMMGFIMVRRGKKLRSLAMMAGGKHLQSDGYTSAGMIIGLAIVFFTENYWLDNIIAMGLGLILAFTCFNILRKAINGIMDQADMELIDEVVTVLKNNRDLRWIDIHNLRVIKYGTSLHIDCHVTLPWYLDLKDAHEEMDKIQKLMEDKLKTGVEFFIHSDPCIEDSCSICPITDCKHRKHDFKEKIEWNIDNLISNKKHGIR